MPATILLKQPCIWYCRTFNLIYVFLFFLNISEKPPLCLKRWNRKGIIQSKRGWLFTQPVQFVWSLSFNIWVPHNSRGKKKIWQIKKNTINNVAEVCRRTWEIKNRSYSRIRLMPTAPITKINIGWYKKGSPTRNITFFFSCVDFLGK